MSEESRRPNEIAGFVLERRLGKGGMGAVYRARHPRTGAAVAVKVVLQGLQARDEVKERFRREVRAMAAVEHPNMVRILEAGEDDGSQYYVMELVDGVDLSSYTQRKGALDPGLVRNIGRGVFSALQALHEAGILHRDLKPHNVMLDRSGRPMIMDLGLTRIKDMETMTKTGALIGSPRYMPPELLEGKPLDARADIYQAGLILWECATAETAVSGETFQEVSTRILTGDIPEIEEKVPGFPPDLAEVIHRCLEVDLAQRIPSAAHALAVLEGREALGALPEPSPEELDASPEGIPVKRLAAELPGQPPRDDRASWTRRVLAVLGFLAVLAYSFLFARSPPPAPPQDLDLAAGVSRVTATWLGTAGVPVQLVAQDEAGNRITSPAAGARPIPPLPDGRRRLVVEGLRPGTEYQVYLTYGDERTLPRVLSVPDALLRERSPRLGATAHGSPALVIETLLDVRVEVAYPRQPQGVARIESQPGTSHTLPLEGVDLARPGGSLLVDLTDPTGKVTEERLPLTDLLRATSRDLAEAAEAFDVPELIRKIQSGESPAEIKKQLRNGRLEERIQEFLPLAEAFFLSPDLESDDRRRAVAAIERLRDVDHLLIEREMALRPSPDDLLAGSYGPAAPPKEPWEIRQETREDRYLIHEMMPQIGRRLGSIEEYVIELPKLPRERMGDFVLEFQVDADRSVYTSYLAVEVLGGPRLRLYLRDRGQPKKGRRVLVRRIDPRDVPKRGGKVVVTLEDTHRPPVSAVTIRRHRVAWRVLPRPR